MKDGALNITEKDEWSSYMRDQWDWQLNADLNPENILAHEKAWWLHTTTDNSGKTVKHSYLQSVKGRLLNKGCSVCSWRALSVGFNDAETVLLSLCPTIHSYLKNDVDLSLVIASSDLTLILQCKLCLAEDLETSLVNLRSRLSRTHIEDMFECTKRLKESKLNGSLADSDYQIAIGEWDTQANLPHSIESIAWDSPQEVTWTHEVTDFKGESNSHSWKMKVVSRTKHSHDCTVCHGNTVLSGFNDFITFFNFYYSEKLEIISSSEDLSNTLYSSRNKTVTLKCRKCGTSQVSTLKRLYTASKSSNLAVCPCEMKSHIDVADGVNDLATYCKENSLNLLEEWDASKNKVLPETVRRGSGKKRWWKCRKCDFSWEQSPHMRTKIINPRGCPACANRALYVGVNDLQTLNPDIAAELVVGEGELQASEVIAASSKIRSWICSECDFRFKASIVLRANRTVVCRRCKRGSLERDFTEKVLNKFSHLIDDYTIGDREVLGGTEIDLLILTTSGEKLGFEFNGVYWHSSLRVRSRDQHFLKVQKALFQDISLHIVWEDEWLESEDKVIDSIEKLLTARRSPSQKDWLLGDLDCLAPSNITDFAYSSKTVKDLKRNKFDCPDAGKAIFVSKT